MFFILSVVKRNPLFFHEIEWKNNGFLFTTPNIYQMKESSFLDVGAVFSCMTKILNFLLSK